MRLHHLYAVLAAALLAVGMVHRYAGVDAPRAAIGPTAVVADSFGSVAAVAPAPADSLSAQVESSQHLAVAPEYVALFPNEMTSPAAAFPMSRQPADLPPAGGLR